MPDFSFHSVYEAYSPCLEALSN
uniref:Uncharacterized protein n=1 Tax=Arundo donax TaxID=35708 RepID=A0A0A9EBC5_ARUDO